MNEAEGLLRSRWVTGISNSGFGSEDVSGLEKMSKLEGGLGERMVMVMVGARWG